MDNDTSALDGIVCTPAQYERSLTNSSIYCLTRNETIALMIPTLAALVSLFALSFVFIIALQNIFWRIRHVSSKEPPVFVGPMEVLLLSLFSGGFLQALGAAVGFKWIGDGMVQVGGFCSAQGIIQQLGETVSALTILVIAVYALLGGWLRKDIKSMPIWVTQALLMAIWLSIAFITMLGNVLNRGEGQHFESPTPYWCWIGAHYVRWRIWAQYFWFWVTMGVSFFTCIPLYLWSRGNLQFSKHTWWKFSLQKAELSADPELRAIKRQSLAMLAHPVVYSAFILPLNVARWITFLSHGTSHISTTASLAIAAIFTLTPAANVIVLLATRTDSGLFGKPKSFTPGSPSLHNSPEHPLHSLEEK